MGGKQTAEIIPCRSILTLDLILSKSLNCNTQLGFADCMIFVLWREINQSNLFYML